MDGNSSSKDQEEQSEEPMFRHPYGAIQQGDPDHADRDYLHLQRDRLMYHEIAYVRAQFRMVHKPVVKRSRRTEEQSGSKQKEGSRRKDRQKDPDDSQNQTNQPYARKKILHPEFY